MEKKSIFINEYALKIKGIFESLESKHVSREDGDLVSIFLNVLITEYKMFKISMTFRENVPPF